MSHTCSKVMAVFPSNIGNKGNMIAFTSSAINSNCVSN